MIRSLLAALGAAAIAVGAGYVEPMSAQTPAPAASAHSHFESTHSATSPARYTVPRTPWGDPDLQGIWSSDEEAGVPFERPTGQQKPDSSMTPLSGEELKQLSKEDAMRILQALEDRERQLQQERRKAQFRKLKRSGKDW